jgi:DNA-binding IclR family transcriptional regulator
MSVCVAQLMAVLQRWPNGLTAAQVAELLSIGRQTASNRLSRMASYGHCEKLYPMHGHKVIYRLRKI